MFGSMPCQSPAGVSPFSGAKQESLLEPGLKHGEELRMGKDSGTNVEIAAISVWHTTGGIFVPLMATVAGLIVSVELHSPDWKMGH